MKKYFIGLLLLTLPFIFNNVWAQSIPENNSGVDSSSFKEGESANCSEYFSINNVNLNLSTDLQSYSPGDVLKIRGVITNKNKYPVVGLDIKARLIKEITSTEKEDIQIIILDEFDVLSDSTISSEGQTKVDYSYVLPFNIPKGQYKVHFYAIEQDRFNISGLYFTNNIFGSYISFDVNGSNSDHVYLDQSKIKINEQEYNVLSSMPEFDTDKPITVEIPLQNPESESKEMTINYELYSFDNANSNNLISTSTENVIVPENSELILKYNLTKGEFPVYHLSITSKPTNPEKDESVHKEKSISNIRFMIKDLSKPRISFVTTNMYPLKVGEEAKLVTCFQNTSNLNDTNISKIETLLMDGDRRILSQTKFEGNVMPTLSAIVSKFTPSKDVSNYIVRSTIYDSENKIIDEVEKKYSCDQIDPSKCPQPIPEKKSSFMTIIYGILTFIIFIGIILVMKKISNNIKTV